MIYIIIKCYGDSNTYAYDPGSFLGDRLPAQDRWVNILAEKMNCTVINDGENGREIPRNGNELAAFHRVLGDKDQIDLLIVMLGTNDLLQGNSVTDVTERMERFLRQINMKSSNILLIGPPRLQRGAWIPSEELVAASKQLSKAYKNLAACLAIPFVDAGQWELSRAYDGVHLTKEGHRTFAEGLFSYLNKGE